MKKNLLTVIVGAVLILIFVLLLFTFQVRKSEEVVVATFMKPTRNIDQPGLYFKWPWPIQKVYRYDQRVQNFEDKYSESYTADNITLLSSVYVGWKITDASTFIQKFPGDTADSIPLAQSKLEGMLRTAKLGVMGKHALSDIVNPDPRALKFEAIEQEIEQAVQAELQGKNYGFELVFLGFKRIGLPDSVTQTVFDRMKNERGVLISQLQSSGDSEALKIKASAERQASEMIANATATARQIEGEGEAKAAETYKLLDQNPDLASFLLKIRTLPQLLNQHATMILDDRAAPFDLFTASPATNSASH
ncbi:MAG TPA: protease modulator HflC [Verrucomicrobiae bacterium]|jgi:membrane protease subunit HflC